MTLGVRQVKTVSGGVTTTTDYPFTAQVANPDHSGAECLPVCADRTHDAQFAAKPEQLQREAPIRSGDVDPSRRTQTGCAEVWPSRSDCSASSRK